MALTQRVFLWSGVQQGCPWAPLLFNLVAQSLAGFLQLVDINTRVRGHLLSLSQHDTDAFLEPHLLPLFKTSMQIFADATGLQLNVAKSTVTLVGDQNSPRADLALADGFRAQCWHRDVVPILGVQLSFCNTLPPAPLVGAGARHGAGRRQGFATPQQQQYISIRMAFENCSVRQSCL
jgi:hypothetical protein